MVCHFNYERANMLQQKSLTSVVRRKRRMWCGQKNVIVMTPMEFNTSVKQYLTLTNVEMARE